MNNRTKRYSPEEILRQYKENPSAEPDVLFALLDSQPKLDSLKYEDLKQTTEDLIELLKDVIRLIPVEGTDCFEEFRIQNNQKQLFDLSNCIFDELLELHL